MTSLVICVVVTFLSVCLPLSMSSSLPGLQMLMSKKGLDYANNVAQGAMSSKLKDLSIPDQSGHSSNIEWKLTGIENREVTAPSSSMSFDTSHNGLSWSVSGLGVKLHSRYWRIKYKKGWFKVSTSGSVDLHVKRASVQVTVSLGQAGGHPSVSMSRCHATIGDVDVYFHGGTAFILNLFRGIIGDEIKDLMQGEICGVARGLINKDLNGELNKLKVSVDLGHHFLLDYSLVTTPMVRANSLALQNNGEVYWRADVVDAPLSPRPIPDFDDSSRMLYLWVSDYVANTAIHHASAHGFLQYNVTDRDFPSSKQQFMGTTCSLFCIGNLIPLLGLEYPDARVEASVTALGIPVLSMTPDGISLGGTAQIDLHVVTSDMQTVYNVITFEMDLFLSMTGSIFHERLAGEITEHRLEVREIRSPLGDINPTTLNTMLKAALDLGIVPGLNDVMREGLELPVTEVLSFKNAQIHLLNGSILIATDISARTILTPQEIAEELRQQKQRQQQKRLSLLQQHQERQRQQQLQLQQQKRENDAMSSSTTAAAPPTQQRQTEQPLTQSPGPLSTEELVLNHLGHSTTQQPPVEQTHGLQETTGHAHTIGHPQQTTPSDLEGQGQTDSPTQLKHRTYCDRLMNFCHASINFCS